MKIRLRTVFMFLLAVLSGALLLHTSQNVHDTEVELAKIQDEVNREKDSIRLLKTEWAYLNSPDRLETLARQYLNFVPTDPTAISTDGTQVPPKIDPLLDNQIEGQPVSYTSPKAPTKKPAPEKSFNDVINQVTKGGAE